MRPGRILVVFVLALAVGCGGGGDSASSAPSATPAVPARPPRLLAAGRPVSTRAAFDLIATGEGAVLVWGVPTTDGGGVRALALDPHGGARGHEVVVVSEAQRADPQRDDGPGQVEDVAATVAGARIAVGWIVRHAARARVQATISSFGLEGFAPPRDLGPTVRGLIDGSARGRIAAWTWYDGSAVIAHQLEPAACTARAGTCARFVRVRLDGEPARADDPLEVSDPCESALVGGLVRGTATFHAICHGGSNPVTTLYAIDPAGSPLASAVEILAGCVPTGLAPGPTGAVVVGRCPEGLGAHQIGPRGEGIAALRRAMPRAICEEGRPVLELVADDGTIRFPLSEPISRLEAMLPEDVAPSGARAVWTGEVLLVAGVTAREVTLRRFECELGRLVRSYP
jgi:hypothetical protein